MRTYEFVGEEEGREVIVHLDKKEYANLEEFADYHLRFHKEREFKGEISRWSPFRAKYKSYDNKRETSVSFRCPECGCTSCERENPFYADPFFFQGHFKCSRCGERGFDYASDCWVEDMSVIQLDLFEDLEEYEEET